MVMRAKVGSEVNFQKKIKSIIKNIAVYKNNLKFTSNLSEKSGNLAILLVFFKF